jgi:hypothetical protein
MSHTGNRHTTYDEMMEWPDNIKIDRASPIAIIDDRYDMIGLLQQQGGYMFDYYLL